MDTDDWDVTDILTGMGLVEWLTVNDPENPEHSVAAAIRAARWVCALHEATQLLMPGFVLKDVAMMLHDGHAGFKSMVDVANYVVVIADEGEFPFYEIAERARARTYLALDFQHFLKEAGYYVKTSAVDN